MTLPVFFGLILIAAVSAIVRWRRLSLALSVMAVAGLALAGTPWLPGDLLDRLRRPYAALPAPEWGGSNAIVVLGSGSVRIGDRSFLDAVGYGRMATAAMAYRTCKAEGHECKIIASGGAPRDQLRSEADVMSAALAALGIPSADIERETRSRNTFENARLTSALLKDAPFDRVFVVTSAFHMKRSLMMFEQFGVEATPIPAFELGPTGSSLPLGFNIVLFDIVLHEYAGLLQYHIYNAMGWNNPR